MEDIEQQETETFQPEESQELGSNFENAFDSIGKDIEKSCNELIERLDNLDF